MGPGNPGSRGGRARLHWPGVLERPHGSGRPGDHPSRRPGDDVEPRVELRRRHPQRQLAHLRHLVPQRVGDDASAIQSAIDACGTNKVVKLAAGTFQIGRTINIPSTVVLRGSGGPGAGASQTTLQQTGGQTNITLRSRPVGGFTQMTNLAADAVKDTFTAHPGQRPRRSTRASWWWWTSSTTPRSPLG